MRSVYIARQTSGQEGSQPLSPGGAGQCTQQVPPPAPHLWSLQVNLLPLLPLLPLPSHLSGKGFLSWGQGLTWQGAGKQRGHLVLETTTSLGLTPNLWLVITLLCHYLAG